MPKFIPAAPVVGPSTLQAGHALRFDIQMLRRCDKAFLGRLLALHEYAGADDIDAAFDAMLAKDIAMPEDKAGTAATRFPIYFPHKCRRQHNACYRKHSHDHSILFLRCLSRLP